MTILSRSTQRQDTAHILIIGGGMTGMSAAFYLERAAKAVGVDIRYTLVERDPHLGGKIRTEVVRQSGEYIVEAGPDSFVTQKPWGLELIRDLGLEEQLIGTNQQRKTVYVLVEGKPRPMPEGMSLVVPTKLWPFLRSPLLSMRGKLRMLLDLAIPRRRDSSDETLARFIRRRLGREALERIGEPLMAGIHNAECERQSLLATFPRFRLIEEKYGSLIRGMRAAQQGNREQGTGNSNKQENRPFVSLRGGIGELARALAGRLEGRVVTGRAVAGIECGPDDQPYRVRLDNGQVLDGDALILTTPAFVAADLLEQLQPDLAHSLRAIRYVSTGTVSLAFRQSDFGSPLEGYGLVIPRTEHRQINAVTMSSIKFSHRAPDDAVLARVFVGGSHNPAVMELDDEALLRVARDELHDILGVAAAPLFARVFRWNRANPQYDVGHLDRVAALEAACAPGLYLAGSAYRGVGIPDCARQGREAAERALAFVREQVVTM